MCSRRLEESLVEVLARQIVAQRSSQSRIVYQAAEKAFLEVPLSALTCGDSILCCCIAPYRSDPTMTQSFNRASESEAHHDRAGTSVLGKKVKYFNIL